MPITCLQRVGDEIKDGRRSPARVFGGGSVTSEDRLTFSRRAWAGNKMSCEIFPRPPPRLLFLSPTSEAISLPSARHKLRFQKPRTQTLVCFVLVILSLFFHLFIYSIFFFVSVVGKSCILQRYADDRFSGNFICSSFVCLTITWIGIT